MDYNKHTKPLIYPKINCMRNRKVYTYLQSLLINVRLCKKSVTETVSGYRRCETVTVIVVLTRLLMLYSRTMYEVCK
jgi:hypothetical protein